MKFKRDILTGLSNICRVHFVLFLCNILFMADIGNFSYACIDDAVGFTMHKSMYLLSGY